jgi:uncharacterized phiE125 gp8 family phage protein
MRLVSRTPLVTADPVNPADLADHLRLEAAEAASAMRYAAVAAQELERYADIALLRQTIVVEYDTTETATRVLPLPIAPYDDTTPPTAVLVNADQTTTEFTNFAVSVSPAIVLADDPGLPVRVTYRAGYGDDATTLPADLTHAILDHALRLYDRRGDIDTTPGLAPSMARIAARYRRVRLAT